MITKIAKYSPLHKVRRIPGIGWILAMARNIYIKRNWAEDVRIIDTMLDFFQVRLSSYWSMLFKISTHGSILIVCLVNNTVNTLISLALV